MEDAFVRELFEYVNQCVLYHGKDSAHMKDFLKFLAHLRSDASVANKILINGYAPDATEVRSKEEWEQREVQILYPEKVIHNMVCIDPKEKVYEDRIMYDVSATDGNPTPFFQYKTAGVFAEWLLRFPPCPIRFLEEHKAGKGKAEYMPEEQVIEVTHGFVSEIEACHLLLREYAHFFLHERLRQKNEKIRYDRRNYGVDAYSVAYTICLRFGAEAPNLENIQPDGNLPAKDVLFIFTGLDYAIEKVSHQIENGPMLRKAAEEKARKEKRQEEEKRKKEEKERKENEAKKIDPKEKPLPPELRR